jgi:hypothetical protein
MHSPMHSFGESNAQPITPISASSECGGKRSTGVAALCEIFWRRVFFKSGDAPALSETESIIF